MRRILVFVGLLGFLAAVLSAADVSGKWKGSFDAAGNMQDIVFNLKADGATLTGSVSGVPQDPQIKDGKIQGDKVTFWFMTEYQGNPIKLICSGQLSGDEIHFTMGLDDGNWSTEFVVKRS